MRPCLAASFGDLSGSVPTAGVRVQERAIRDRAIMLSKWIGSTGLALLALMTVFYVAVELGGMNHHTPISVSALPVIELGALFFALLTGAVFSAPAEKRQARFARLPIWRILLMAVAIAGVCLLISYYFVSALVEDVRGAQSVASATVTQMLRSRGVRYNCAMFIDLEIESRGEVGEGASDQSRSRRGIRCWCR